MRASLLREHDLRYSDDWPRIGEDWIYWAHLFRHGAYDNIDEALVLYRRSESNSDFGLDRTVYRERIIRAIFPLLGLPISDDEVTAHLMLLRSFKKAPTVDGLRTALRWMERLRELNRDAGLFDPSAFDARLAEAWSNLFYAIHRRDPLLAVRQWFMGPAKEAGKLSYAAKVMLNRLVGREPNA